LLAGIQVALIGLVADVIANNRKLLEEVLVRLKQLEYRRGADRDPGA